MTFRQEPIWEKYQESRDRKTKEQLIVKYISLVKYVAGRMMISLPPSVEQGDLESAGVMGLIDAIDRYDPKFGVKFESYAIPRIKGAILDELRKLDWVPRSVRSKARELEKAIVGIENDKGRPATDEEISQKMNLSITEYQDLLREVGSTTLLSMDEGVYNDEGGQASLHEVIEDKSVRNPVDDIGREELKELIVSVIDDLPEIERLVIALYYYEELTLYEIGQVLQLSESRISQIHTKTIISLKAKLRQSLES